MMATPAKSRYKSGNFTVCPIKAPLKARQKPSSSGMAAPLQRASPRYLWGGG